MSRRSPIALALIACFAFSVAGCGSGSSSSTSMTSTGESTAAPESAAPTSSAQTTPQSAQEASGKSRSGGAPSADSAGDNSIQTYGSTAAPNEKAVLAGAALSFFRALAASDDAKVCAGLSKSNRQQLQAFKPKGAPGGCASALKTLVAGRAAAEARKAANGVVTGVRIKGDTAFVLFRPAGGMPSYFVMKREGGAWKAISLAPGTPIELPISSGSQE